MSFSRMHTTRRFFERERTTRAAICKPQPGEKSKKEDEKKDSVPLCLTTSLIASILRFRKYGAVVSLLLVSSYYNIIYSRPASSAADFNALVKQNSWHLLPTKPLRKSCIDRIKNTTHVDITTYTTFRKNMFELRNATSRGHPFKGALDRDGNPGYVHDETSLRRAPPPFRSLNEDEITSICRKLDQELRVMRKFELATDSLIEQERAKQVAMGVAAKREKIFCAVYSTESKHNTSIQIIRQTWGSQCDGFMVASTKTDLEYDAVQILHEGEEDYKNMWQKVRSMWAYVYEHYYDKYDWFHMGGDDMYVIVQNLRLYLESEDIRTAANGGVFLPRSIQSRQLPLYLGSPLKKKNDWSSIFNSGGPGYTLNKAALKLLVEEGLPNHFTKDRTSEEDLSVARIFKNFSILPYDTHDENGSERYLLLQPHLHFEFNPKKNLWYSNRKYGIDFKGGFDCCSSHTVAMHYIRNEQMYAVHGILNGLCNYTSQGSESHL